MTFDEWHESIWQRTYQILKEHVCEEEAAYLALEIAAAVKYAREGEFDEPESSRKPVSYGLRGNRLDYP